MILSVASTLAIIHNGVAALDDSEYFEGDGTTYTLSQMSGGNYNLMSAISNAGVNYAALNSEQWDNLAHCGRCAQVSCIDSRCSDQTISEIVQIVDRCPECKHGALDLSPSVFKTITGSDPSRFKIKWKFVDCPVQGNVKYCLKDGSNSFWTAIQPTNFVSGVKSLTVNGHETTMTDSVYYYLLDGQSQDQVDLSSLKIVLTSVHDERIEETVALEPGSCATGTSQFAAGGDAHVAVGNPVHVLPNSSASKLGSKRNSDSGANNLKFKRSSNYSETYNINSKHSIDSRAYDLGSD
uniref:Expansin-like EG45 domain-containing protein n=1 Tax=Globisporangium ultimum (strain ATCC 200006 / CBS 805.95 / DAOM BR144) TaxID=431595 RepID=K3X0R0_GLOUD